MIDNLYLPARYDELIHRLALGIEPIDALTGAPVTSPLDVSVDPRDELHPRRGRPVQRHRSARFVLRYGDDSDPPIVLRIADPTQRYVPRRIRFEFATAAFVLGEEAKQTPVPSPLRIRRPVLFPGAAHALLGRATALRGRVVRDGRPVRWGRIQAHVATSGVLIGRAHCDEHGEFLLVLGTNAGGIAELASEVALKVTVTGPDPHPAAPAAGDRDQLADLPLELAPAPGLADDVSSGERLPAAFQPGRSVGVDVTIPLGRVTSRALPFDLT